jgi:hypothetical protein
MFGKQTHQEEKYPTEIQTQPPIYAKQVLHNQPLAIKPCACNLSLAAIYQEREPKEQLTTTSHFSKT